MPKQELIKRWESQSGRLLLKEVIKCLNKGIPLAAVRNLEKHLGRWDLRGARLSDVRNSRSVESSGYKFTQNLGSLKVMNCVIESVDFSFSDVSHSSWKKCNISNCLFGNTQAKELHIVACNFSNCFFDKTNFSYSFMNDNIAANAGSFIDVTFKNVNLSECIFTFPIIKNCLFENCNLMATNFDGSRMENCRFVGEMNSSWFRGYSTTSQTSLLGLFNKVDPKKYPNKMLNIDFLSAKLVGVSFSHGIDLSNCAFPQSNDYIHLKNLSHTMTMAKNIIDSEWQGEDRRKGLYMINEVYFKKDKQYQSIDIIDTFPVPSSDLTFDDKFFKLIRSCNITL